MNQQPFRYPSGALHREQSICLASKTRQLIDSEADACYHFRKLFADSWLSSQIAFVQVRSLNPPSLLLKPCKPNSFNGSRWEELRSWINHKGFNSGWSATVCSLASSMRAALKQWSDPEHRFQLIILILSGPASPSFRIFPGSLQMFSLRDRINPPRAQLPSISR